MKWLLRIIVALGLLKGGRMLLRPSREASPSEASATVSAGEGQKDEKERRKRRLVRLGKHFALFVAVLAVGGFLVAASGIIPIKASSGHWGITKWFLSFGMHRSFSTHSMGVRVPPLDSLDNRALVLKGAGHYEIGCRPCHGSPDLPQPRIAREMTPHPPYLPPVISEWEPEELFALVKHGVKFTGMPAWPAQQRDDEVWAMVAFLRAMPGLDADEYRRLAHGEAEARDDTAPMEEMTGPETGPPAVALSCARCHGADGLGRGEGAFPRLAGQRPAYLYAALRAYARGARHSGIMEPIAAGLRLEAMQEIAAYYSRLDAPAAPRTQPADAQAVARGEAIARQGIPAEKIPSCMDCHGPGATRRNPFYPDLAGQYADYLVLQLKLFKAQKRGGSAYAHLMHPTAKQLTPEQMRDVALFYESLATRPDSTVR